MTPRTQAMVLLTVHVNARSDAAAAPLDLREWNRLAIWLDDRDLTPESLIHGNPVDLLQGVDEIRLERDRLLQLLDRGHPLAVALDRWASAGIWLFGRGDEEYPQQLKDRLRGSAPVVLFGCGDITTAARRGVAIVGSRNATDRDNLLAYNLGRKVSAAGYTTVSGGARGIDQHAQNGAFEGAGQVVAVLADSLMRNLARPLYRSEIEMDRLLLVTPYAPDTGFSPGNALGRNRLIYCLADTSIAVCSTNGSGGTFAGATQNLDKGWVPLWVGSTDA